MLFEVLGRLPANLDPATRLGLIWEARAVLARAVKDERRATADQASLTPRIMRYAIETERAAQPPKPAPPPPPQEQPAPIPPPAEERPGVGPRRSSSGRVRQSFRVMANPNALPAGDENSINSPSSISSAIDRIFQAEIHSNVSGIPSPREDSTAHLASEAPTPLAWAVPGEGLDAPIGAASDETTEQAPVGREPADISKTRTGGQPP